MSVYSSSPLLKMTKAPPGFRDPIYESGPVKKVAVKALGTPIVAGKKAVSVAVAEPKSSVESVTAGLAKINLEQ